MSIFGLSTAEGALIVSGAAFGLSLYTLAKNRNSVSVYVACDQDGDYLWLTNNSPHAVTIVDMGTVNARWGRRSLLREDPLKRRIDPRDVTAVYLRPQIEGYMNRNVYLPLGAYIEVATGQRFYSRSLIARVWGRLRAWMKISAKHESSSHHP
ncbi:MAG: hypothetical protein ACRESJ_08260 [Pseudomonas sp.]|uniref:hypothetical protein n=1 Tax=Pseudomonas sp. TaxID=306 RepID=UPI003D6E84CD